MMKKAWMILLLAAAAAFPLTGGRVLAQEEGSAQLEKAAESVVEMPYAGLTFEVPDEFQNARGYITYIGGDELGRGDGVTDTAFWYIGMTEEDAVYHLTSPELTDEEVLALQNAAFNMAHVFGINQGRGADELLEYLKSLGLTLPSVSALSEIGQAEDVTFYLYRPELTDRVENLGDFREEFLALTEDPALITDHLFFSVPEDPYSSALVFETTDIDGQPVSSANLFAQHKLTMVNIWTTWCGFCIQEMPQLAEMNEAFLAEDGAIVGLLYDGTTDALIAEGQEILGETGVTYTNLLPWDTMESQLPVQGFPTSFFVNREGQIVGEPIVGANPQAYMAAFRELLETAE